MDGRSSDGRGRYLLRMEERKGRAKGRRRGRMEDRQRGRCISCQWAVLAASKSRGGGGQLGRDSGRGPV